MRLRPTIAYVQHFVQFSLVSIHSSRGPGTTIEIRKIRRSIPTLTHTHTHTLNLNLNLTLNLCSNSRSRSIMQPCTLGPRGCLLHWHRFAQVPATTLPLHRSHCPA